MIFLAVIFLKRKRQMSEPPFLDDGTTQLLAGEDDVGMGGLSPPLAGTLCGVKISRARMVKVSDSKGGFFKMELHTYAADNGLCNAPTY